MSSVILYIVHVVFHPRSQQHQHPVPKNACATGTKVAIVLQIQWFRFGLRCRCGFFPRLVGWVGFGCNGQHGDAQLLEEQGVETIRVKPINLRIHGIQKGMLVLKYYKYYVNSIVL